MRGVILFCLFLLASAFTSHICAQTEAPQAETLQAETPQTETPQTEATQIEATQTDTPQTEAAREEPQRSRGSIPEALMRPARTETPRLPIDTVIGALGRGNASEEAFSFAKAVCDGLLSADMRHYALSSINSALRETYISALEIITPLSFRIGGGREEIDGAFSFLVRFIGRDQGITGELYIRLVTRRVQVNDEEYSTQRNWVFEELLLEEAKDREVEHRESIYRYDFNPYERFF